MDFDCEPMGEDALLLRFGTRMDEATNVRVHEACARLRVAALEEVEEWVPAYASLLLRLRPERTVTDLVERVRAVLAAPIGAARAEPPALHRLPVCYGGEHGADLAAVAQRLGLTEQAVIERHAAGEYRVAMLGFAPGFAYLLGMDPALQVPRLARPRTRVPAGSVGIGGAQTGIYPAQLPGGWQLIGRTPWRLFDAAAAVRPCRLGPGDRVRFEPVDAVAFERLRTEDPGW